MKKMLLILFVCSEIFAVGEAGAVFLLIAPGAGPVATGEAQVAKVDDVYASYYNPAGLAYLNGSEIAVMHVNWLPNLADDIYYDFLAYRRAIPGVGTFGTHLIYLNLGEQMRTDEVGNPGGTFKSNMWAFTGSFGSQITKNSSLGLGMKIIQQNLAPEGAGSEENAGSSTNILFDIGYLNKIISYNPAPTLAEYHASYDTSYVKIEKTSSDTLIVTDLPAGNEYIAINDSTYELYSSQEQSITDGVGNIELDKFEMIIRKIEHEGTIRRKFLTELNFGLSISHIGPKIWFQDKAQADPPPTNMKMGIYSTLYNDGNNKLSILADANKLLVSRYPRMDWDGDGLIGDGLKNGSTINPDGQEEGGYSDPWYTAIFTSWLDDWYYGGDYDLNNDSIIGGWGCPDGTVTEKSDGSYDCSTDWVQDGGAYSEPDSNDGEKVYLEKGSAESRKFSNELDEIVYNVGVEYWYSNVFVIRAGYIHDSEGKIFSPTYGAGLRFGQYGFDFGYTAGKEGHPRANTMFFSINIGI